MQIYHIVTYWKFYCRVLKALKHIVRKRGDIKVKEKYVSDIPQSYCHNDLLQLSWGYSVSVSNQLLPKFDEGFETQLNFYQESA